MVIIMILKPTYEELEQKINVLENKFVEIKQVKLKLENALSEIQRLRTAMDQVPAYVYMKDTQSRYVYANRLTLKLFGCSVEELIGCDDTHFFPPDTVKRLQEIDSRVFAGQQTSEEINIADTEVNRRIYLEVKTPIYSEPENMKIWGLLGISTDITERIQTEEALLEKEKLQGVLEMAGAICHELNQPLQIVSGFSEILLMDIKSSDPKYKALKNIEASINQIGILMRKIMGITHYKAKPYLKNKIVDIEQASQHDKEDINHD
ncbi:MAG: PAS domain-containing protein [Proteobacteria bacterium]|nr:PAS domain S-box protein [Desulfobacula sp.]MBU3953791.1 PAS domain-containing protein [Pseudomonadota bacterium]MBU4129590.1 PAS domain-containing protein [Pseudomonadota bacterium]